MAKHHQSFMKKEKVRLIIIVAIVLLILLVGFFVYYYFILNSKNNYRIENQYYGFEIKTPKAWVAKGMSVYSEENIAQLLTECENDKSNQASVYEIGRFRFEDQKYPQGFGDQGYFPAGFASGAILDVSVNCMPSEVKDKMTDYNSGGLQVSGEKAFEEFLNLPGFGKTKYLSFLHNNFQYNIREYVYFSPVDKKNSQDGLDVIYAKVFNEIISTLKFFKIELLFNND